MKTRNVILLFANRQVILRNRKLFHHASTCGFHPVRSHRRVVSDAGGDPGRLVRAAHGNWYIELFQPFVAAGPITASALAGYRSSAVFLRGAGHVPPRWETVRDAMLVLFDLLEDETEPSVRAVLGHWLFGCTHPYPDGNGRMVRFLMNVMLASGTYPWMVIRVEDRDDYLAALEAASIGMDIEPFAGLVAKQVRWSLEQGARTPPPPV